MRGPNFQDNCERGHELSGDNLFFEPNGDRGCRKCRYIRKTTYELRVRYGINSIEERDAILAAQGNACAICGRTDCTWGKGFNNTWHIDHDHSKPGTHRGIVCGYCNLALGRLEPYIRKAFDYLRNFQ